MAGCYGLSRSFPEDQDKGERALAKMPVQRVEVRAKE